MRRQTSPQGMSLKKESVACVALPKGSRSQSYQPPEDRQNTSFRHSGCSTRTVLASDDLNGTRCPLWVKSRHSPTFGQCPLYPQKQTLGLSREMSALCHNRKS